MFLILFTVLSL